MSCGDAQIDGRAQYSMLLPNDNAASKMSRPAKLFQPSWLRSAAGAT